MTTLRQKMSELQLTEEQKNALQALTKPDVRKVRIGEVELEIDMERDTGKLALAYAAGNLGTDKEFTFANGDKHVITADDVDFIKAALFEAG